MKIAFVIEYFPPFSTGGSEWSTYYLAKQLTDKGVQVVVITPSYGQKISDKKENFKVIRFPFYKKFKDKKLPGHFFYTNPLWIIYTSIAFLYFIKKENVDLIHVQGKYSLPGVRLANLILKKPIVLTARDYQLICSYGFCLYETKKGCTLKQYFQNDFRQYYKEYVVHKSLISLLLNLMYAIWGRISKNILQVSAKNVATVVLSGHQKEIYEANGFKNVEIIGNSITFNKQKEIKRHNKIVYAGRLTPGKGIRLLISAIPAITSKFPAYEIIIIGEGFLKGELIKLSKKYKQIKLLGQIGHSEVMNIIRKSKLTIVPSLWPEPFGRVVMESILSKTPVVATRSGALPEILNKRWGTITDKTPQALFLGIKEAINKNKTYTKNITEDSKKITALFSSSIPDKYIKLYQKIIK